MNAVYYLTTGTSRGIQTILSSTLTFTKLSLPFKFSKLNSVRMSSKIHHSVHTTSQLDSVLNKLHSVHTLTPYFKTHLVVSVIYNLVSHVVSFCHMLIKYFVYTFQLPMRAICPDHLIFLALFSLITYAEEYTFTECSVSPCTSFCISYYFLSFTSDN